MPLPETKINETQTLVTHFCFKKGGSTARYALIKELDEDKTLYYVCEFQPILYRSLFLKLKQKMVH